jgi:hypothetical protein
MLRQRFIGEISDMEEKVDFVRHDVLFDMTFKEVKSFDFGMIK